MFKKIFAAVIALVMALGVFSMNAFAATDVVYGDITNDGNINSQDALKVLQTATGMYTATAYQQAVVDVNSDGNVNSSDALLILQYATDLVKSFNKSYDNTQKAKKVDPVFANGAYTFTLTLSDESSGNIDVTFSTDGKAKVMYSTMKLGLIPVEYRLLHKDGKNYQIVPTINLGIEKFQGVYCETDDDISSIFDTYEAIFMAEVIYASSTKKTINGQVYDCETFCNENNAVFEYCYYDGALEFLTVSAGSTTQTLDISNLMVGAETSKLIIPSDCVYDESAFQS
ncbi:MAG: dockerin type I repeat-containing protein [Clostridia bacterium]|nr:dockerin type I repeat-containing protein [Clostridia bacterium]